MTAPPDGVPGPTGSAAPDKPTRALPTERVRFEKQLDLLRAYAAVSGSMGKIVTVNDVAKVAKLNASTVSLCNGFFVDVQLLDRSPAGGFVPSPEVLQFQRLHAWDPDHAAFKLAPKLRTTWFFARLNPKLLMGPLDRIEAVRDLADSANAHKKYENQLLLILDYLESAGLVRRDGETLRLGPTSQDSGEGSAPANQHSHSVSPQYRGFMRPDEPPPPAPVVEPTVMPTAAPRPGIHFNIDVSVDMAQIGTWGPQRITAFFDGVAKVLAAKNGGSESGVGAGPQSNG